MLMSPLEYFKDHPQRVVLVLGLLAVGTGAGIEAARWIALSPGADAADEGSLSFPKRPKRGKVAKPLAFDRLMSLLAKARDENPAEAERFVKEFMAQPKLKEAWDELQETQDVEAFRKKLEKSKGFGAIASSGRFANLTAAAQEEGAGSGEPGSTGFFGLGGGSRADPVLLASAGPSRRVRVETPGGPVFGPSGGPGKGGSATRIGGSDAGAGLGPSEGAANPLRDLGIASKAGGSPGDPGAKPPPEDPPTEPPPGGTTDGPDTRDPPEPPPPPRRDPPGSDLDSSGTTGGGGGGTLPDLSQLGSLFGGGQSAGGQGDAGGPDQVGGTSNPEPAIPAKLTEASAAKYLGDYAAYYAGNQAKADDGVLQNMPAVQGFVREVRDVAPQHVKAIERQPDPVRFLKRERGYLVDDQSKAGSLADRIRPFRGRRRG